MLHTAVRALVVSLAAIAIMLNAESGALARSAAAFSMAHAKMAATSGLRYGGRG